MAVAAPAAVGTDRYDVGSLLGKGGMGAVYRARDRQNGDAVALKRLTLSAGETRAAQLTELFHQEFRTLAQLQHPHIVRAHDFGIDDSGPYYTMELLEGRDLHGLSPLPWREACMLLRDVCSAAALLHSRRLLHRDLSPKNMQRTQDGRAKLLDFGAMAPMGGPSKTLVGTPPLVPPEALLQQALDGRADLFALGGTLYYALTGVHAYPARNTAQLRELWKQPLLPPSARVAGIPAELDTLVLSLLSLERIARPRSAAEVIDRLTAIAALAEDDRLAVSHAYLSTPELSGRSDELAQVRARIGRLCDGRGGALVIEGAPGMGRSRMLDTTVLEAKLAGIAVARASAADASAPYAVVTTLLRQLCETLSAAQLTALGTGGALALLEQGDVRADVDKARRAELQAAVISVLRACTRTQPLLLAIDDIERCDEPSQAALAAAAETCRKQRILLAVTLTSGAERDVAPLALLSERAARIALAPFAAHDTEALLGSVFGEVPYLEVLAARIHARAEGNPRDCLELAQHLTQRGLVRYELGSWALPAVIDDTLWPSSLSWARRMKIESLSADARALGEALAIAEGSGLGFEAYAELTTHGDRDRVRLALDELLFAQVLRVDGVLYAFEAQAWAQELSTALPPDQTRRLHAAVADALERRGSDRLDVARALWLAGERSRALDTLLAELALGSRWDRCPRDYTALLQGAAAACLELGRSRRERFMLLCEIVKLGHDLLLPDIRERLRELFLQLRDDSGLSDWEALDATLEALPRLQCAIERAQARHDAAPPQQRGLAPLEAIIELTRLVAETTAVGAQAGDITMFELMPKLDAFFPLSTSIERVQNLSVPAGLHVIAGRYEKALELYYEAFAHLKDPSNAMEENMRAWAICALHHGIGSIEAGHGRERALEHAEALEKAPGWQIPAWAVRLSYYVNLGNLRQAERCRRRIELMRVQSAVKPPFAAASVHQHVYIFSIADNLTGMRRAIPEIDALSSAHPGLAIYARFARAEHARICGNHIDALAQLDTLMQDVKPGESPLWPWIAGGRVLALTALERLHEARADGMRDLAVARGIGLGFQGDHVESPLALAEARLGDFERACARLDRIIEEREHGALQGVVFGWIHEARARVALWMGDHATFEHNAQRCAQSYKKAEGEPALAAKYERLMQEARNHGIRPRAELAEAVAAHTTFVHASSMASSGMGSPTDDDDTETRVLDLAETSVR